MAAAVLRPEIVSSWDRAAAAGLAPDARPDPELASEIDPGSRLLLAAGPVLDDLAADLDGSRYAVILADSAQRLIDLRYGRRSLRSVLEGLGAVQGLTFDESRTGTNSIATAFELRQGIAVHGAEHYLESFKRFACYGIPVFDPVTKRTAGVLDITCPAEDANDLLKPFLARGAREIESRLLAMSRRSHRAILEAFERATSSPGCRITDPVIAFGDDVVLANDAASEHLRPVDHATLRLLAEQLPGGTRLSEIGLAAGPALVGLARVDGGTVVRIRMGERDAPVPRRTLAVQPVPGGDWLAPVRSELDGYRSAGTSVLVLGRTGTGRSSAARAIAGPAAVVVDAAAATVESVDAAVRDAAAVVIEEIQLLSAAVATRLAGLLTGSGVQVVGTALEGADRDHVAGVAALCPVRVGLPSLRARRDRIPAVAADLLKRATAGRSCFTPKALQALAELEWPGNLRELATVVAEVAARRSAGDVTEADLPPGYRGAGRPRVAGALWQAERDAVVAALRDCAGNKVHAAEHLGISRTTLYRRLRVLRIDPDALRDRRAVPDLHS